MEALCYGWIDSIYKKIDKERFAQRFSPRKPKSELSQNYADTYWYWALYQSPKVTNIMSHQIQVQ